MDFRSGEEFGEDFSGGEISGESGSSACAEAASNGASSLSREAEGHPFGGRNHHHFDLVSVVQFQEQFFCLVSGGDALFYCNREREEDLFQLAAQILWQIAHFIRIGYPVAVYMFCDLISPV